MKRFATLVVVAAAMLLMAPATYATRYVVNLSGGNENPATPSAGTGTGLIDFDTTAHTLQVNIVFSGLSSPTTASHIHCCVNPPGNAGVATTTPTFLNFPLGVTSGTYNMILDTTQASSWNPAFITANGGTPLGAEAALAAGLAAGQPYLNIHTTAFPGGEIRGLLVLETSPNVPTLSEWALAGLAALLVVLAFVTMRRRAR